MPGGWRFLNAASAVRYSASVRPTPSLCPNRTDCLSLAKILILLLLLLLFLTDSEAMSEMSEMSGVSKASELSELSELSEGLGTQQ